MVKADYEAESSLRLKNKLIAVDYVARTRSRTTTRTTSTRTVLLPMDHEYTRAYRLSARGEERTI